MIMLVRYLVNGTDLKTINFLLNFKPSLAIQAETHGTEEYTRLAKNVFHIMSDGGNISSLELLQSL